MSAPQQRSRGSKGSFRYIPKNEITAWEPAAAVAVAPAAAATNDQPASRLTTSLRSSAMAKPSSSDKGNGGGGGNSFVIYLPQDEAVASGLGAGSGGLDAVESQAVVNLLNDELSRLLKMKPRDFWREVAKNESLHQFLDSYLQFRSRWHDFPHRGSRGMVAGVIVGEADLCRRVFLALYRISSNRDPGAHASDCLSVKEHAALLQEKKLLDLPKLLDICAIYGHENGEHTKLLVTNAIRAQPQFLNNLGGVVSHFLNLVHTMHNRCNTSLEVLPSCGGDDSHRFMQLSNDFLEVMDFINDAIMTFDAFADACAPAALHFCVSFETSYGNDELLNTLARLHDSLIPSMISGFSHASNIREDNGQKVSGVIPDFVLSLKVLSTRIVKFGWKLLDFCYLHDELADDNFFQSTTKMFPASVEDPFIRGDILVQTLKEINGEAQFQVDYHDLGTFIENIEKNYKIFSQINSLCNQGWVSLDKEQLQYLSRILNSPSSISSASAPLAAISSHINQLHIDEDAVLLDSKISQIKDLFPDYGKGFLKACLDVYNHDPEEVIGRILEGTLHEDLLSLDMSAEHIPPANQISLSSKDKGKALMEEPLAPKNTLPNQVYAGGSSTFQSSSGRYTRKSNDDKLDSEVLDSRSAKNDVKSAVLAAEFEYEDEYDDSFDDLGMSIVESGYEEQENLSDRMSSLSVKPPSEPDQSSSSRWNSQRKPLFYVKDGKNYSYKVSGSVGVASAKEAAIWNQTQKELIHGLGRGGNLPLGAAQNLEDSEKEDDQQVSTPAENSGRGNSGFRGRGGRRGGGNHHRKDRAMKKHFSGISGY